MPRELERPAAPYRQIADELREMIRSGALSPGDRVPSVRTISRDYQVAHATAYRAITALQAEGYVRAETGVGNLVTTEEERGWSASSRLERSRRTGKIYPPDQHAKITEAGLSPATEQAASVYGVEIGTPLARRARVTYRGERPLSRSVSWFPAELAESAPKLLLPERILEGTFAYVATASGRKLHSWQDQYEAAIATADDAALLDVAEGAPVFHGRNWIYDDHGEVLEYGESIQAGRIGYRGEIAD